MANPPYYAPAFELAIGGTAAPAALRASVTAVRYQDGIEGADRVELALSNHDFRWFGHPLLKLGQQLDLKLGYVGDVKHMFTGDITGVDAAFPSSGAPTLTVVAHDFLHRLTRGNEQLTWAMPDPAIVGLVAAKHGLTVTGEGSAVLAALISVVEYLLYHHERRQTTSDFDFLTKMAGEYGLELYIDPSDPNTIRFSGLDLGGAPSGPTLSWGRSLIEFTPRVSTVGQVNVVAIRIYVQEIGQEFVLAIGADFDRTELAVSVVPLVQQVISFATSAAEAAVPGASAAIGVVGSIVSSVVGAALEQSGGGGGAGSAADTWTILEDVTDPVMAIKRALAELTRRLNQRLTGSGSAVGNPDIRGGAIIAIDGLGKSEFNGRYRVTSASHSLDSGGYRTSFEVRRAYGLGDL